MNNCIPIPLEKYKYNVILKAGYSGKLVIEDVDACEIVTLMQFFNRMRYYDYYGNKDKITLVVEGNDGESK